LASGALLPGAGARTRDSRGDAQRIAQLDGAHPFLASGAMDGPAGCGSCGRPEALAGLARGRLSIAYHGFALGRPLLSMCVEVEPWDGLVDPRRIGRVRPRVIPPGVALVLPPPGTDHPWRETRHDLWLHRHRRVSRPTRASTPGHLLGVPGQASAVIWARGSGVQGRLAPARGASRTPWVGCQRRRHCRTISAVPPTWRAIAAWHHMGWWGARSRSRARGTAA
jgi:hypothetical protein